jgi:hypothetical protein
MDQLPLANSLTHLVLKDKLTICNGNVLKMAPPIPLFCYLIVFLMTKMTYLLFPNPSTPLENMKVGIEKNGQPFK